MVHKVKIIVFKHRQIDVENNADQIVKVTQTDISIQSIVRIDTRRARVYISVAGQTRRLACHTGLREQIIVHSDDLSALGRDVPWSADEADVGSETAETAIGADLANIGRVEVVAHTANGTLVGLVQRAACAVKGGVAGRAGLVDAGVGIIGEGRSAAHGTGQTSSLTGAVVGHALTVDEG